MDPSQTGCAETPKWNLQLLMGMLTLEQTSKELPANLRARVHCGLGLYHFVVVSASEAEDDPVEFQRLWNGDGVREALKLGRLQISAHAHVHLRRRRLLRVRLVARRHLELQGHNQVWFKMDGDLCQL